MMTKRSVSKTYQYDLSRIDPNDPAGRTYAEVIAEKIFRVALGSDHPKRLAAHIAVQICNSFSNRTVKNAA